LPTGLGTHILLHLKATINIVRPVLAVALVIVCACLLLLPHRAAAPARPTAGANDAAHLVAILQYLQSDYPPAVASGSPSELAEQRSLSGEAVAIVRRLPEGASVVSRVESVDARVQRAADPRAVSVDCQSLVNDLVALCHVVRTPVAPPDLELGARLFSTACAPCHGSSGYGDGLAGLTLNPRPANFHSRDVMTDLTPFKAESVVRFGVKGTAMVPFDGLDEKDRWALAFYVFTLRQPNCTHAPVRMNLEELANHTDAELAARAGEDEVACLRRQLPPLDPPTFIARARSQIDDAARMAKQGDARGAEAALLGAYLDDIEPIEPWLRARDGEAVTQLEASFTEARAALRDKSPRALDEIGALSLVLDRAAGSHAKSTALSVFWLSSLVVVREGFEAAVIIAALLAVLKKRNAVARARWVHAGWISAIAVGALVFALGRTVIAGAMNEKLEGYLAFVAAAMLLHAAMWLNAKSTTRQTMGALRDRTEGAVDGGVLSLFGISFLAMFRESFETAVFLEALSIDAPSAATWGAVTGAATLSALVFGVGRLGLRLPMRALFKVSTGILLATAVMLVGKGVHSFEEVGLIAPTPVPFFQVDFLGVYRDRMSLLAQFGLLAVVLAWQVIGGARGGASPAVTPGDRLRPNPPR
jgi:high-affinity iron transporter